MAVAGRMHSGWGLDHRRWLPLTAGLLVVAALIRAAAGLFAPLLHTATLLWLFAWGTYLFFSWKTLANPRLDGGQGCDEPEK